jgi:hypothetical protein
VRNRSVVEVMVIVFTLVVAFMLMGVGTMIIVVEMRNPQADTALVASTLMNIVSGIVGALLGLMVNLKTNGKNGEDKKPP